MTETVLPQLEEILSELTTQEEGVATQLAEIQSKLAALQSVILLFNESTASMSQPLSEIVPTAKAAKQRSSSSTVKTAKTKRQKKDGRAATWQKYTRSGVNEQPMPEAVRLILATKPKEDFKIADVMSALFQDNMPKAQYLKARNRISNILSGGVRNGEWYKGERGAYRLKN